MLQLTTAAAVVGAAHPTDSMAALHSHVEVLAATVEAGQPSASIEAKVGISE